MGLVEHEGILAESLIVARLDRVAIRDSMKGCSMLPFQNTAHFRRRDFLQVGALGAAGLNLASYLRLAQAGELQQKAQAKSAIVVFLGGGPTQLDTFDMKPDAPAEYRGDFKPI